MSRPVAVIVALWAVAVAIGLGARGYWTPDEPRHAEVAREMLADGTWLRPTLHGEPYPDKPPLFFWLVAGVSALFGGVTTLSARIPTAMASLGCALTLYGFAKRLYGPRPALASAVVLLTGGEFLWLSQRTDMNVWVTWCVLGAIACGVTAAQEDRRGLWAPVFLLMGLGLILKGPVVVLFIVLVLTAWICAGHGGAPLRRVPLWAVPLVAIAPLAWAGPLWLSGQGAYLEEMILGHGIGMAVGVESHEQGWHYYLAAFPVSSLPWVIFLPWALVKWWRDPLSRAKRWLPILWVALPLIALSIASAKRSLYMLPAWPAVALAVGYLLAGAPRAPRVPSMIVGALFGLGAAGIVLAEPLYVAEAAWGGWAMGAALAAGGALAVRGHVLRGVAIGAALSMLAFRWDVAPRVEEWMSGREVAQYVRDQGLRPSHSVGYDPAQIELEWGGVIREVSREAGPPEEATCVVARLGGRGWSEEAVAAAGFHVRAEFAIERRTVGILTREAVGEPHVGPAASPWVTDPEDQDPMAALRGAATDRKIGAAAFAVLVLLAALLPQGRASQPPASA